MWIGFKLVGQGGVSMKMCISGTGRKRVNQFCRFLGQGSTSFCRFYADSTFCGQVSLFFYRVRRISLIPAVFFICVSLFLY